MTVNTIVGGVSQGDKTGEHSILHLERPASEQKPVTPGSDGEIVVEVETQREVLGSEVESKLESFSSSDIFKVTEL